MKAIFRKVVLTAVLVATLGMAGVGCRSSSSDPVLPAWYDVYGNVCGYGDPAPGCNFYWDGYQMTIWDDPYYFGQFLSYYDGVQLFDTYGFPFYYYGYGWWSPDGVFFDDFGYALNKTTVKGERTWMEAAGEKVRAKVKEAGIALSERHQGLTAEKGIEIAETLNDWNQMVKDRKNSRARTDSDYAAVTRTLYGISSKKALAALEKAKEGGLGAAGEELSQVATHWATDPATLKEVLKDWYGKKFIEYGIQ